MFKPLALFMGFRYMRSRKKNRFVSFISLSSMLGIALGVMVLITVLSVKNGFDEAIYNRFFGMVPEVTVRGVDERISDWEKLEANLSKQKDVKAAAPFVSIQSLISYENQTVPLMLTGVLPAKENAITHLQDKLLAGNLETLGNFGIILGKSMADKLNLMLGDKVTVMIPQTTVSPAGMIPRYKRFTVTGVFSAGPGFGFDSNLAFINLQDAQKLTQLGKDVSGIKLRTAKIYEAPALSWELQKQLGHEYQVSNWTEQFGAFFEAIKMEKVMLFSILILIIAVAAFNLVSSLVMVVNDKQAEIAILRTIGATPGMIVKIFIVQGMTVGIWGTFLGLMAGIILSLNISAIADYIQYLLNVQLVSSSIYFVDHLPSKIELRDLVEVCLIALVMSFLATIYPAWRASRTVIAEALHYE